MLQSVPPEIQALVRRAEAAREYTTAVGRGVEFSMRLPTRLEAANAAARAARLDPLGQASVPQIKRELLLAAVHGWTAVLASDLLPQAEQAQDQEEGRQEGLPFLPPLAAPLLDARPEWEDALWADYAVRAAARSQRVEAAEKNSSAASTGSSPEAMRLQSPPSDSAPSSETSASPTS